MYESMYGEEKAKRANSQRPSGARGRMLKKWMHLQFMTELVYNLIFTSQTIAHLLSLEGLDDQSIDSTKTLWLFNLVDKTNGRGC